MSAFTFKDQAFLASAKSSGVTPDSFPGLHRWYKADSYSGVGSDGDSVGGGTAVLGEWIDQTGSGDDANHPTSGGIFKTNIVGTKPVIRQTNEYLNFAPGSLGDFTIVCAHRRLDPNTSFLLQNTANNDQLTRAFGGFTTYFFAGVTVVVADAFANPADFMVLAVRRSGTSVTFRENKTARGGGTEAPGFLVTEIGSNINGSQIDHGELMIWTSVLSDADLDQLYDEYLKPRWTTLP